MRLRNIPGAKDAILECDWVIDEPERFKGKWESVFGEKRPLFPCQPQEKAVSSPKKHSPTSP